MPARHRSHPSPATLSVRQSEEIESRGRPLSLVGGLFVAIPSGMGVALGITGGGVNALVGVAISAALLPPIVNSGLCWAFALWYSAYGASDEVHLRPSYSA